MIFLGADGSFAIAFYLVSRFQNAIKRQKRPSIGGERLIFVFLRGDQKREKTNSFFAKTTGRRQKWRVSSHPGSGFCFFSNLFCEKWMRNGGVRRKNHVFSFSGQS